MSIVNAVWDIAYTTDDASDATPTWTTVSNSDVRMVSVARGRESELGRVEAGTAQITLNNRSRQFDPTVVSGLRPMNRWRLRAVYNAVTYDVFLGYVEAYEQSWPATGVDSVCVVRLVDEFKVLALDNLPNMDPPRDTYADVVMFDEPQGYWRMGFGTSLLIEPAVGSTNLGIYTGSVTAVTSPIVGDWRPGPYGNEDLIAFSTTGYFATVDTSTLLPGLETGGPGDASGLSAFTFETWFKSSEAAPAANRIIAEGPYDAGSAVTWAMVLTTTGKIAAAVRNTTPTTVTATGATSISANTWYHVAMTYDGANIRVYLNGVQDGIQAQTGAVVAADTAGAHYYLALGRDTPGGTRSYDEVAWYRYTVAAARLLAHYTAGAFRGFPTQDPGARITAALNESSSIAPTSIRAGSREMQPTFMRGQNVLDELRHAESADNVDAMLFIAKDGSVTFLDDGHRSVAPWNTVQATFDDDGTDLPYQDLTVDYSESFLYNDVNVTRTGGTTSSSSDATSISRYFKRTLSLTDLPITDDADQSAIATALLAKYKDPMTRIVGIGLSLKTNAMVAAVLALELGDRVRILRTPVGGGARIDQTAFVQSINLTAVPGRPWELRLGVSPL